MKGSVHQIIWRDALRRGRRLEPSLCPGGAGLPCHEGAGPLRRVAPEVRAKLILYQNEAARVLRDHFLGSPSLRRHREDIKTLVARRRGALALLKEAQDFGLLSDAYVARYVQHSLAIVDGTEAPDGPRLIDVSSFLEGKGFDKETTRLFASRFGKKVRVLFEEKHGQPPRKVHRMVNGSERLINSYTELDLPLFEKAFELMIGSARVKALRVAI